MIGRLFECPGSWRMTQALKAVKAVVQESVEDHDPPEYLVTGNLVHQYLATPATASMDLWDQLSADGQWLATECVRLSGEAFSKIYGSGTVLPGLKTEDRLWSKCGRYSGQYDVGVVDGDIHMILDYKTGRIVAPEANVNYQLRTLAVLDHHNSKEPPKRTITGIIQPRSPKPLTLCEYSPDDIKQADLELNVLMDIITEKDAPLKAGDWCTYCPARSICPVATKGVTTDIARMASDIDIEKFTQTLTPVEMASIAAIAKRGRSLFDAVEDRMKEMLENDKNAIPGWKLSEPKKVKKIESAQRAFELLSDYLSPTEFASCCKVSFSAIEPVFHEALSETNGATMLTKTESRKQLRSILAPALIEHDRAPSLEQTGVTTI